MLTIYYHEFTYFSENIVQINYDADTDDLLFDYTYHNQHLENYDYDYERIRTIITKKNIEQFFKVRTFKAPEGMFVDTEGYLDIEVSYNDKKRTLNFENRGERIYTKSPVILIEEISEYVEELNCAIRKQCDPFSDKDHEEILNSVGKNVRIKHKAQCVWFTVGFNAQQSEILEWCKIYGISYDDAMKWKTYMYNLWLKDQRAKAERESKNSI